MATVRELIEKKAAESGKNLAEISRALGRNHAYLQQFLKRGIPRKLPEDIRAELARILDIPEESLKEHVAAKVRVDADIGKTAPRESSVHNRTLAVSQYGERFKPTDLPRVGGSAEMPLYRFATGGKGAPILEDQPFETVTRPDHLSKVREPYGVMIEGVSMLPEWQPGWVAEVNPNLTPRPGDTCIFRGEQVDGTHLASIKILRRETDTLWHVEQHNPPRGEKKLFSLKKAEFQVAHVVTGADRRRR
jgi:phage repressor protein C with HTH and peptisase S24 domain